MPRGSKDEGNTVYLDKRAYSTVKKNEILLFIVLTGKHVVGRKMDRVIDHHFKQDNTDSERRISRFISRFVCVCVCVSM